MRAPIRWAVHLYPPDWRVRYGAELGALLEDVGPGWGDFWDVMRGALTMRMQALWNVRKVAAACGLAGALVAAVVAFQIDNRYVSTTVLRMSLADGAPADSGTAKEQPKKLEETVLSRGSLASIMAAPDLDLYQSERRRVPMEDVVQLMRNRDIRIAALRDRHGALAHGFILSFEYSDPARAQRVARALAGRMMELNRSTAAPGAALQLEVLDPASLPQKPFGPNRLAIVILGLLGGLALGLLFMAFRRRPAVTAP